jgi:hypothetical protein
MRAFPHTYGVGEQSPSPYTYASTMQLVVSPLTLFLYATHREESMQLLALILEP